MASERRQQILLGALAVVLVLAVAYNFWPSTAGGPGPTSNRNGTTRAQRGAPPLTAPDVHLDALTAERPKPEDAERNLFKFRPAPAPPPARPAPAPPVAPPVERAGPASASVPPIQLKFLGYIGAKNGPRFASLSDGIGAPIIAAEGETNVLGRYKIWRIGEESIEISYVDGRGRQTIRLTGQ